MRDDSDSDAPPSGSPMTGTDASPDTAPTAPSARGAAPGEAAPGGAALGGAALGGAAPAEPAADAATARMTITFKLYATLQGLLPAGAVRNAVTLDVPADTSLNDVIDRHRVPRPLAHLVLVNGRFVGDADRDARGRLRAGDVVAVWPPVAGG